MNIEHRLKLHDKCEVSVKPVGPHWGLYCNDLKCKKTGAWIKWINQKTFRGILKK
jgi:hypothetical protein